MENMQTVKPTDPVPEHAPRPTSQPSGPWWAAPAAATLVVVCCAGPLLLGALFVSGAAGWLGAHGFLLGATSVMVVAGALAVGAWMRVRRG